MTRPTAFATLPLAASLLAAVPAGASPPVAEATVWHLALDNALADARASDRLILIDLTADWCGWCKKLERDTFADPAFRSYAGGRFVLLRVDVEDGAVGSRLRDRFDTRRLPTTLVVDRRLARVGRVDGYQTARAMIARLEAELTRHRGLLESYRQAMADDDPEALRAVADRLHRDSDGERAAAIYRRLLARHEESAAGRTRLELALADAHRLAGEFEDAERALGRVRDAAGADPRIAEAAALLEVLVARDRGDCRRTTEAVESLLDSHPKSRASVEAITALRSMERDPTADCD